MFLRNAWYAAGWSRDYERTLTAETFLGEEIVIFRREDGSPVALQDACPHRKLPLSCGQLKGDTVECGYHGLTFDGGGRCVAAPTQPGSIPRRARVKSYPAIDRYGLLWIWMGDPEAADPDLVFPIENFDDPSWGRTDGGVLEIDCNYLWICDNLLDPSHVAWVHVGSFAGSGTDDVPLEVTRTERGVIVWRWIRGRPPSPYYAELVKFDGPCDRLQHYEMCVPGIALNKSVYTPAGTGGPGAAPVPETYVNISYNFMTPITAERTRYIWFQHRNTDPQDTTISQQMNEGARQAFEEDRAVLERVQRGMARDGSEAIDLGLDAGAKLFRRHLERLIDEESAGAGA
jgi:vanillate O-demethylase monooxygenase subunit